MLNKCLKYGKPGHRSNKCYPKNLNLVEAEVGEAEVNDEEDDKEALELQVDEGEMLNCIVQKIVLSPKFENDNQCNKILRKRGIISDKVYNVIIDSGSIKNIISKALVNVMELSTEKYPALYRI